MSEQRVLVTGSTGLIGEALVESLRDRPFEVHGVARTVRADSSTHRADLSVPAQVADLLDRVNPSVIVHLAGGRETDVARLYASNVLTTVNLLQAAARLESPPAFITVGSAAEYGEPAGGIASESDPAHPLTEYGRAKLAASALAQSLAGDAQIRLCIVRPFNVVSPHLPASTALGNMRQQLVTQQGKTRVVRCGRLDVVRDFVPLKFVVEVLSRLLDVDDWPRVLNVCSGTGIELGSVLHAMGVLVDAEVRPLAIPELTRIPAAARIVGDSSLLHGLGLHCEPTPELLARLMIEVVTPPDEI
jgi:nucleoside-diphosphate-sugar epimerase